MIFNNRITDITYNEILPTVVDTKNDSNPATARTLGTALTTTWVGTTMNQVIQIDNDSTGGSFDGLDQFSTAQTNNTRSLTWYVKGYYQSVVAAGMEQDVNANSEAQAIRYLTVIMDRAKVSMLNGLGNLMYGVGTGKDIEGFGLIADDSSLTSSYGGLARATYGANINAYVDTAATLTFEEIAAALAGSSASGIAQERPQIGYMPQGVWDIFESLFYAAVQAKYDTTSLNGYSSIDGNTPKGKYNVPGMGAEGGFDCLAFRKIPFVPDQKAPSGTLFGINEHYLEVPVLRSTSKSVKQVKPNPEKQEGYYSKANLPAAIQFRDMMESINQYGSAGFFLFMANVIHRNPQRNFRLNSIAA
jgi:hypothetical protein